MNIHMQRQTTGMPYLLKDKKCVQQITRPRMGKKTQAGVQHLLYQSFSIHMKYYNNYYYVMQTIEHLSLPVCRRASSFSTVRLLTCHRVAIVDVVDQHAPSAGSLHHDVASPFQRRPTSCAAVHFRYKVRRSRNRYWSSLPTSRQQSRWCSRRGAWRWPMALIWRSAARTSGRRERSS